MFKHKEREMNMYYIGVDLGGTNIAVGLVSEEGRIITKASTPTINTRPIEEIVADMAKLCHKVVEDAKVSMDEVKAIGVGAPGTIDSKNGVIVYSNNIKMENVKIREMLQKHIDKPINLENDANAAAYGEYYINGNNAESFVFITLGTGVGGGIVINGKIYRGFNGAGAELGHITTVEDGIECTCGHKGCWEAYASVTALIRQTKEAMDKNPDSMMHKWLHDNGKVSGRTAFDCAKKGDMAAQSVVDNYIKHVGEGLISVLNIFQPEKILIGGGISKEGDYLLNPIKEYAFKGDYNKFMPKTSIEIATLFNDAGIIGAAISAK